MKKFLVFCSVFLSMMMNSQIYSNQNEKFDEDILFYIQNLIEKEEVGFIEYMEYSKPFSKWDMRPIEDEKVWFFGELETSSGVPNFFYGIFGNMYGFELSVLKKMTNDFLNFGVSGKQVNINYAKATSENFIKLAKMILESKESIFVQQDSLKRVGNIFYEKDEYWKYKILETSPFPMSNDIEKSKKMKFNKEDNEILEEMEALRIYAVKRSDKGVFLLLDGFTDNSYGYYYSENGELETDNHLFDIMFSEKIENNLYYFVAN